MQQLAYSLKPLVVNMNSILSIAADMKYPSSSSQQLKKLRVIFLQEMLEMFEFEGKAF